MFGISLPELIVVGIIALILLGPERLPAAARTLGSVLAQFRKQSDAIRKELYNTIYTPAEELKREVRDAKSSLIAVKEDINKEVATLSDRSDINNNNENSDKRQQINTNKSIDNKEQ